MTEPLEFPFELEQPRSTLLAPLRSEIERLQHEVLEKLALLERFDSGHGSMFQDAVAVAVASDSSSAAFSAASESRREAWEVSNRRNGYDTWPADDLDQLEDIFDALAASLTRLGCAWRELSRAEARALHDLSATA
jgi:hypothetical protein